MKVVKCASGRLIQACSDRVWHGPKALMGYTEVPGAGQVTGIRRLSVISQTLLEAITSCLKSFPESSLGH